MHSRWLPTQPAKGRRRPLLFYKPRPPPPPSACLADSFSSLPILLLPLRRCVCIQHIPRTTRPPQTQRSGGKDEQERMSETCKTTTHTGLSSRGIHHTCQSGERGGAHTQWLPTNFPAYPIVRFSIQSTVLPPPLPSAAPTTNFCVDAAKSPRPPLSPFFSRQHFSPLLRRKVAKVGTRKGEEETFPPSGRGLNKRLFSISGAEDGKERGPSRRKPFI